jgi:hypothetical protein
VICGVKVLNGTAVAVASGRADWDRDSLRPTFSGSMPIDQPLSRGRTNSGGCELSILLVLNAAACGSPARDLISGPPDPIERRTIFKIRGAASCLPRCYYGLWFAVLGVTGRAWPDQLRIHHRHDTAKQRLIPARERRTLASSPVFPIQFLQAQRFDLNL